MAFTFEDEQVVGGHDLAETLNISFIIMGMM